MPYTARTIGPIMSATGPIAFPSKSPMSKPTRGAMPSQSPNTSAIRRVRRQVCLNVPTAIATRKLSWERAKPRMRSEMMFFKTYTSFPSSHSWERGHATGISHWEEKLRSCESAGQPQRATDGCERTEMGDACNHPSEQQEESSQTLHSRNYNELLSTGCLVLRNICSQKRMLQPQRMTDCSLIKKPVRALLL